MEVAKDSADPAAAKKTDKKAPKGGAGKAPDEVLKEELEQIRNFKLKGWILLDFPKSLTQIKLLEQALTGYESKTDLPKDEGQVLLEAWSKVTTPGQISPEVIVGETRAASSGIDGVVILETPVSECERRAKNRKIDPTTQTVYHMEDNPPADAKVTERLEDYTDESGDTARIAKVSGRFE